MVDGFNRKYKPAGAKSVPQHEIDARLVREKTERLRALRLAQAATNPSPAGSAGKPTSVKKTSGKSAAKPRPLSDWLDAQEKAGRRN